LQLHSQVKATGRKIQNYEALIEQFKFEIALLKRHKFAKRSEQIMRCQLAVHYPKDISVAHEG
jgi:transposase